MRHDHQAMRAAAGGGFIVILRNEFRDGFCQFVAESRPVRRRPETNLGVYRQGRQALPRLFRATNEVAVASMLNWALRLALKTSKSCPVGLAGAVPSAFASSILIGAGSVGSGIPDGTRRPDYNLHRGPTPHPRARQQPGGSSGPGGGPDRREDRDSRRRQG